MTFVLKQAREKKGFTQEYVADILDISRQTYSKIEKGETEPSLGSAVKLMELLEVSLDDFKYHEVDNQTSISFSREKYHQIIKNCIKYGASNDGMITKTKLAKLCYLADFARYYNHLEPLTNLKYLKMDQGPVPNEYFTAIEMLQAEESIAITQKGNAYLIENITDPDSSELNEDELRLIKKIGKKRKDADTKEIVDFTHSQLPWRMTDKMDEVPYAFISQEYYDHVY